MISQAEQKERNQKIRALREQGMSRRELADMFGLSKTGLRRIVTDMDGHMHRAEKHTQSVDQRGPRRTQLIDAFEKNTGRTL